MTRTRCALTAFALASCATLPVAALAQAGKTSAVIGMVLEPTGLDPTMAPAAAIGEAESIYQHPQHAYSKTLLAAVPRPDPERSRRKRIENRA
jgi:hypothetical protein